jgi:hypothetical protein
LAFAVLLTFSGFQQRLPGTSNGIRSVTYVPLARWTSGLLTNGNWALYAHLVGSGELPSGVATIVVADRSRSQAWGNTFYVSALNGDLGSMQRALSVLATPLSAKQAAAGSGTSAGLVAVIRAAAQVSPQPPRIIVTDPKLGADISASLRKAPEVLATVITDPGMRRS